MQWCQKIFQKEWADPDLGGDFNPEWNSLDKSINRVSHEVGETWCSLFQQQPPPLDRVLIKCKGGGHWISGEGQDWRVEECWASMLQFFVKSLTWVDFLCLAGGDPTTQPTQLWQGGKGGRTAKSSVTKGLESRWTSRIVAWLHIFIYRAGARVCCHPEERYRSLGYSRGHGRPRREGIWESYTPPLDLIDFYLHKSKFVSAC